MLTAFAMMAGVVTFLGGRVFADDTTVLTNGDIVVKLNARPVTSAQVNPTSSDNPLSADDTIAQIVKQARDIRSNFESIFAQPVHATAAADAGSVSKVSSSAGDSQPTVVPGATRQFLRALPTVIASATAVPPTQAAVVVVRTQTPEPAKPSDPPDDNRGPGNTPGQKPPTVPTEPQPTSAPVVKPQVTPVPTQPPAPGATRVPDPEPQPVSKPDPTRKPQPTSVPKATQKPDPTQKPESTRVPDPTQKPESTKVPDPTQAPPSTAQPEPTQAPPAPTVVPDPTQKPDPTEQPQQKGRPVPTAAPTAVPSH